MRERCPVAYSDLLGWSLFRHADVLRALNDPETFSSAVSAHPAVPNGMDPPEHTRYRRIVETYFQPDRMAAFEPRCRQIAADLVGSVLGRGEVEFIEAFAHRYAVSVQCAFLGWPDELREPMLDWTHRNDRARFAEDRAVTAKVAREFEGHVVELLQARRAAATQASDDVTSALMHERIGDRALRDDEIVSILRNWTVGEIGTISAAVGILADFIAQHGELQQRLRVRPSLLPDAIDEILRIHAPLAVNRRVTTRPVEIGGRLIGAGERISLNWVGANLDGRVFDDPQAFRLDRDPAANLLYGAGIHFCPGAPLARLELRVALEELLARSAQIEPIAQRPPTRAPYPAIGLATLALRIR
ncbi:MAG: cytochrome P450 [Burkholderiaceae bacterium]|nr:cytochrome P450 [Burkholderiaceae bacterium]